MEELFELRTYIEQGNYSDALAVISELEEMSLDDKINKIRSFCIILLLHLIKQHAEKRTTRSWDASIRNSVREIAYTNKRKKSGGFYLKADALKQTIADAWETALEKASLESFVGRYEPDELAKMINPEEIKVQALQLVQDEQKRKGN